MYQHLVQGTNEQKDCECACLYFNVRASAAADFDSRGLKIYDHPTAAQRSRETATWQTRHDNAPSVRPGILGDMQISASRIICALVAVCRRVCMTAYAKFEHTHTLGRSVDRSIGPVL